ncbi:hypothetical protein CK203_057319 [Vitis vinifera]|uniref:Uncharacterized protein n=1 Tax=Vitis vinifera TaxID=29760 RepID=A0A438GKP5_VITVI|nr:hypothetical protein CK203_057319 [Vitis vinifera]
MDVTVSSRPDRLQRLYIFRSSQRILLFSANGHQYLRGTLSIFLSRGTFTDSIILRKELLLGMLLVDVVLHSNLFPLQHSVQRR